jgi:hypothetical protein
MAADSPRPGSGKSQLLRKFLLLDSGAGLFRNLVGDRDLWLCFFRRIRRLTMLSSDKLATVLVLLLVYTLRISASSL